METRSEKEKMLNGELYNALDPQLVKERNETRLLLKQLNNSGPEELENRQQILKQLFGAVGENLVMEPPFYCDYGRNIYIGNNVFFNFNCLILDVMPVTIGNNVLFGPNVQIYTATHPLNWQQRATGLESGKAITIGSDVWIGGGAIICPGVNIGSKSVVGAGSVVTRSLPEAVFAAGNPCKVIRNLEA